MAEVPAPGSAHGRILVATRSSLISTGTERSTVTLGEKSLLGKARARPDLVKKVVDSLGSKGVAETIQTVRSRLGQPSVLGYSGAGIVLDVGSGVEGFNVGDRVACAGQGIASHAEVNSVPRNLAVPLPEGVDFDEGSFVALGAIALHGVRTAEISFGDHVAVIGLGLVGLITVQLLKTAGCVTYGVDLNPDRVADARRFGCDFVTTESDELEAVIMAQSDGRGADAVLITASTSSSGPVEVAGAISRDRGSVCVVGDVGLDVPREPYYMKELTFRISRSYGPGRYDKGYEFGGIPYPVGFVPWDQRRNMASILDLIGRGALDVRSLVTETYAISDAPSAYARITGSADGPPPIAIVLHYDREPSELQARTTPTSHAAGAGASGSGVAVIGAGSFASATLLPRIAKDSRLDRVVVATRSGSSAASAAEAFGFAKASTSPEEALAEPNVGITVIATRHDSHASLASQALRSGHAVFLEKPLAINQAQLDDLVAAVEESGNDRILVGFNRRFSGLAAKLRGHFPGGPQAVTYRVNAGALPADHWTRDPNVGGGRIIGEGCHFVDLISFLVSGSVRETHAFALPSPDGGTPETVVATLRYDNGAVATLEYVGVGDKGMPKELIQAFGHGRSATLENFKTLTLWRGGKSSENRRRLGIDKGYDEELKAFFDASLEGNPMPIPFASLVNTTLTTFAIEQSIAEGGVVKVG